MPFVRHSALLSFLFLILSLLARNAYAIGVSFTTPAAGSTWPAGPITVRWIDAGGTPNMAALETYTLDLVVGGNDPENSAVIATIGDKDSAVADGQVQDEISADIAQSIENGFYFRMTSKTTDGNTVINYSYRFTLINMKGSTASAVLDGANAARGSDDVPPAQYNVIRGPTASATASSSTAAAVVLPAATEKATKEPDQDDDDNDGTIGLGTGARVGIGIGVILAIIGAASIFGWIFMIYRHKKKRRRERTNNALDKEYSLEGSPRVVSQFGKAELPARSSRFSTEMTPMEARSEMSGDSHPYEAARASIYELDSGWDGWEAGSGRKSRAYDPTNVT